MTQVVDLASAPIPVPSVFFLSGLVLCVVFSVIVRRGHALHGYDPLTLAGLSRSARLKIRTSISNRRLPDDPSLHPLVIEWSEYEVAVGRRGILEGILGTFAVLFLLCVAYDFSAVPAVVIVVAIVQALFLLVNVAGIVIQIRRLPLCEQLARDRDFQIHSAETAPNQPRDSGS